MTVRSPEFDRLAGEFGWDVTSVLEPHDGLWLAAADADASISYPHSGHASLRDAEERSFWFRERARAIVGLYRRVGEGGCIWEIGAGNGHIAAAFVSEGLQAVAVEPGPVGAANASDRGVPTIRGFLADLHLPSQSLASIGMFDVLEHIENPQETLAEVYRVLRPGAVFLLTVPAYQWLWSDNDIAAGHFRRYSRRSLDTELSQAGFRKLVSRYLFPSLVLPMALRYRLPFLILGSRSDVEQRVAGDLDPGSGLMASAVAAFFTGEGWLTRTISIPFGTSILGAYRRA